MPRFYISDGARPGPRVPRVEHRTKVSAQSDCLNEAQAISRGRKLEATKYPPWSFRYWRIVADGPIADYVTGNPDAWMIRELVMKDAAGTNLAYGAMVIEIGHHPTYNVPGSLNDGNNAYNSSYWMSPVSGTQGDVTGYWVGYDFGTPKEIATIEVWNPTGSQWMYNVASMHVEGSQDGNAWTFVAAYSGLVTRIISPPGTPTPPSILAIPARN